MDDNVTSLLCLFLGVVGLFSLPKVYETHQEKIDQNVDVVRGKVNEVLEKYGLLSNFLLSSYCKS